MREVAPNDDNDYRLINNLVKTPNGINWVCKNEDHDMDGEDVLRSSGWFFFPNLTV